MSEEATRAGYPPRSPVEVGARGRCPCCGKGRLFDGYLATAERCDVCGLDYGFVDSADGPAVFIIMVVGFLVVGLALLTEVWWSPPLWLHVVLWTPLILVLTIGLLRPLKGVLIALQYRNKAAEGRLAP
jgi:uncharacterized protein (DUF983 family)